jgi:hypothetical protein
MTTQQVLEAADAILQRLAAAEWRERESVKEELLVFVRANEACTGLETHLEASRRGYPLEVRWEIDEVLEAVRPVVAPEPEPEEEEEESPPETSEPLVIYDDPRGLVIQRTEDGNRYLVTQHDPHTGQPQTVEVPAEQFAQIKEQLRGSPYWVLGSGEGA